MFSYTKKALLSLMSLMFFSPIMPYINNNHYTHHVTFRNLSAEAYYRDKAARETGEAIGQCIGSLIERAQRKRAIRRLLGNTPEARIKAREIVKLPLYLQETFIQKALAEKDAEQLRIKQLEEEKRANILKHAIEEHDKEVQEHWRLKIMNWLITVSLLLGIFTLIATIFCLMKRKKNL